MAGHVSSDFDGEATDGVNDGTGGDSVIEIDSDEDNGEAIEICDTSSEDTEGDDEEEDGDVFGQKCQAPFSHPWGQSGYYNAIVLARAKNIPKDSEPMVSWLPSSFYFILLCSAFLICNRP